MGTCLSSLAYCIQQYGQLSRDRTSHKVIPWLNETSQSFMKYWSDAIQKAGAGTTNRGLLELVGHLGPLTLWLLTSCLTKRTS